MTELSLMNTGIGQAVADYNTPRQCIRYYFPTRSCFTFPHPLDDMSQMKHLEEKAESQLSKSFVKEAKRFKEYICKHAVPKRVDGQPVSGRSEWYLIWISETP